MRHPVKTRQRVFEAYGNFWFGDSDGPLFWMTVLLIASVIVGLCACTTFPLWAVLLLTTGPVAFLILNILAGYACVADRDLWYWGKDIKTAWGLVEKTSAASRNTAEDILREIVAIVRKNTADEVKREAIEKRLAILKELVQVDINLQQEIDRNSIDDVSLEYVRNVINSIEETRQDLVARRV